MKRSILLTLYLILISHSIYFTPSIFHLISDLAEFIVNCGKKEVEEVKLGWEIEESEQKLRTQSMSRMEIQENAFARECTEN